MTKEITKAFILQRMTDELSLRELVPEKFALSELVTPVYNIEKHLRSFEIRAQTVSISSTGGKLFFQPTYNERWTLNGYTVVFVTGAFTAAGLYISRAGVTSNFVYLDLTAAQSTSYTVNLPKAIEMVSGDKLYVNIDGYTSTGDLQVLIDISAEIIR